MNPGLSSSELCTSLLAPLCWQLLQYPCVHSTHVFSTRDTCINARVGSSSGMIEKCQTSSSHIHPPSVRALVEQKAMFFTAAAGACQESCCNVGIHEGGIIEHTDVSRHGADALMLIWHSNPRTRVACVRVCTHDSRNAWVQKTSRHSHTRVSFVLWVEGLSGKFSERSRHIGTRPQVPETQPWLVVKDINSFRSLECFFFATIWCHFRYQDTPVRAPRQSRRKFEACSCSQAQDGSSLCCRSRRLCTCTHRRPEENDESHRSCLASVGRKPRIRASRDARMARDKSELDLAVGILRYESAEAPSAASTQVAQHKTLFQEASMVQDATRRTCLKVTLRQSDART